MAALASGCVDASLESEEADVLGGPISLTSVTGTAMITHKTASGDVQIPRDLRGVPIAALVPGSSGNFLTFPGSGTRTGTFEIRNVPLGPYYLLFENRFIVTSARTLDLGRRVIGRTGQQPITNGASLTFDVGNMPAWQDGDFVELYAPNAGAAFSSPDLATESPPLAGDTTLGFNVDYGLAELPNAIDPSLGDAAFLIHVGSKFTNEGVSYQALSSIANLDPFSLRDGGDAIAHGVFQPVPQDRNRLIDWRIAEYRSQVIGAVPGGATQFSNSFFAFIDFDERARYSLPVLFSLAVPTTNNIFTTVSYGDPFPRAPRELVRLEVFGFGRHIVNGQALLRFAGAGTTAALDDVAAGPIRPTMGPVQNLRVAGQDASGVLTGLPPTPEITWDLPAFGAPDSYSIQVLRFVPNGPGFTRTTVARILTAERRATLPPGALVPGMAHFILVRAQAHPNITVERFSFESTYPFDWGDQITTLFTP